MKALPQGLNQEVQDTTNAISRVARLTPGQRDCLILVARLRSSKQIAAELGISRHTVDQRIARACQTLGTTSRQDAARLFVQASELSGETCSVSESIGPYGVAAAAPAFPQLHAGRAEAEQAYLITTPPAPASTEPGAEWPFPTAARQANTMSFWRRLAWAMAIAAGGILIVGMLLASLAALKALS